MSASCDLYHEKKLLSHLGNLNEPILEIVMSRMYIVMCDKSLFSCKSLASAFEVEVGTSQAVCGFNDLLLSSSRYLLHGYPPIHV